MWALQQMLLLYTIFSLRGVWCVSYEAKVFNLMIASPSDVASERSIVRDVVYEWNAVNSKSRNKIKRVRLD
jgi:hypothetical protein